MEADAFRALAETIPHKVWVGRVDGSTLYVNRRWIAYTGIEQNKIPTDLGKLNQIIVHPDDYDAVMRNVTEDWLNAREFEFELRCRRHDGAFLWHNVHNVPVINREGAVERWVCTITDIDERKKFEFNMQEAREAAEKASQAKSAFLVNISHEIRTPLNSIIGYSELLSEDEISSPDKREMLNVIIRNGRAVAQIIDDILDLSKIEAGKFVIERKPVVIAEVLRDVVSVFDVVTRSRGIIFEVRNDFPIESVLMTDPARLRQILLNLVGNSVKFTQKGQVMIEVKEDYSGGKHVVFRVRDTGIGIKLEDQKNLFNPFVQADESLTRKFGGSGLGLALSRRLARAQGGDIILEASKPDEGSIFTCSLKADLVSPEKLVTQPRSDSEKFDLRNQHILIVEDSKDSQTMLRRILERESAEVDLADNGVEGCEKALKHPYDVILMDIQMPLMNGYEATRKLRLNGYSGPIVALTAHALKEEREKCLASGCTDFLTKPLDKKLFLETIAKYTQGRNVTSEAQNF